MNNNLRFIKGVIYSLKREYGEAVDFYKRTTTTDLSTGNKAVVKSKVSVNRVVALPQDLARKFLYDAVFLKHDRTFAYGATFDLGDRVILVDRKDLPRDYLVELNDYLIIKKKRYEVKKVDEFEFSYLLTVTEFKGLDLSQIVDLRPKDNLSLRELVQLNIHWALTVTQTIGFTERTI